MGLSRFTLDIAENLVYSVHLVWQEIWWDLFHPELFTDHESSTCWIASFLAISRFDDFGSRRHFGHVFYEKNALFHKSARRHYPLHFTR